MKYHNPNPDLNYDISWHTYLHYCYYYYYLELKIFRSDFVKNETTNIHIHHHNALLCLLRVTIFVISVNGLSK
jgi:hypothetical protein